MNANEQAFRDDLYRILNPDLRNSTRDPRRHYLRHGRRENRRIQPVLQRYSGERAESNLPRLVIVTPDAQYGASTTALALAEYFSRTYKVTAVFGTEGPVMSRMQAFCNSVWIAPRFMHDSFEAEALAHVIAKDIGPTAVIINSISGWHLLPHLGRRGVPTVTLVHEFADYVRPDFVFHEVALWSTKVVFPAETVLRRALDLHPNISSRSYEVIPQALPSSLSFVRTGDPEQPEIDAIRRVNVVGAGTVSYRKGVDLFVEACREIKVLMPEVSWSFRWLGPGFDLETDLDYSVYLAHQVNAADLSDSFEFVGAVDDVGAELSKSDVLVLTSRLDPFPNVAIEAMREGIPIICFEGASGVAAFLADVGLGPKLLATAFSPFDIAQKLKSLVASRSKRTNIGNKLKRLWQDRLTLPKYGRAIEDVLIEAVGIREIENHRVELIRESDFIDLRPQSILEAQNSSRLDAISEYCRAEETGISRFRPVPYFNSRVYRTAMQLGNGENAFSHYLERGRPQGSWMARVINVNRHLRIPRSETKLALHIHVHYPDVLDEIFRRIRSLEKEATLVISVTSDELLPTLRATLDSYGLAADEIIKSPSQGRNFSSLFELGRRFHWDEHTLLCHVHTKKSLHLTHADEAAHWRGYLLDHLLGPEPVHSLDWVIDAFEGDPKIGMLFPEDPFLIGFDANKEICRELAFKYRLEVPVELGDFPVGGMMWIRGNVLSGISALFHDLDFEPEPIGTDGSTPHAIERILPWAVSALRYQSAISHLEGSRRL